MAMRRTTTKISPIPYSNALSRIDRIIIELARRFDRCRSASVSRNCKETAFITPPHLTPVPLHLFLPFPWPSGSSPVVRSSPSAFDWRCPPSQSPSDSPRSVAFRSARGAPSCPTAAASTGPESQSRQSRRRSTPETGSPVAAQSPPAAASAPPGSSCVGSADWKWKRWAHPESPGQTVPAGRRFFINSAVLYLPGPTHQLLGLLDVCVDRLDIGPGVAWNLK